MGIRCEQCGGINYYTYKEDNDYPKYGCKDCDTIEEYEDYLLETENDLSMIRELAEELNELKCKSLKEETEKLRKLNQDMINHPEHYKKHPSGIECIEVTEHMDFCLGNAIKYIWRSAEKGKQIEDLKKAIFYINRKINLLQEGD